MHRAIAIVDGEHYPPVVRDALAALPYDVVAAVFAGGTEKLRGAEDYGVPLLTDLERALAELRPDVVVDLSDEPVLDPVTRMRLVATALAAGVPYVGPDFRFEPPALEPFELPSVAVVGTGKRVGKTAVTGVLARRAARSAEVVVVAMGRGGPVEPEVMHRRPTVEDLLALSRAGRHAASDHLETALLTGLPTIGCRRCGGGLAGAVGTSTVGDGARLAAAMDPELVIFDGSGAALPPVDVGARLLVAAAHQDAAVLGGYLTPYRALVSDLVLLTMAEEGSAWRQRAASLEQLVRPGVPVVPVVLRPKPVEDVAGERVAYFGAADAARDVTAGHLAERHGARVVHVSGSLADRGRLREELASVDADTYVIEVKAAAIDVVAEAASARGVRVVAALHEVLPVAGADLEAELDRLLALAGSRLAVAS